MALMAGVRVLAVGSRGHSPGNHCLLAVCVHSPHQPHVSVCAPRTTVAQIDFLRVQARASRQLSLFLLPFSAEPLAVPSLLSSVTELAGALMGVVGVVSWVCEVLAGAPTAHDGQRWPGSGSQCAASPGRSKGDPGCAGGLQSPSSRSTPTGTGAEPRPPPPVGPKAQSEAIVPCWCIRGWCPAVGTDAPKQRRASTGPRVEQEQTPAGLQGRTALCCLELLGLGATRLWSC